MSIISFKIRKRLVGWSVLVLYAICWFIFFDYTLAFHIGAAILSLGTVVADGIGSALVKETPKEETKYNFYGAMYSQAVGRERTKGK